MSDSASHTKLHGDGAGSVAREPSGDERHRAHTKYQSRSDTVDDDVEEARERRRVVADEVVGEPFGLALLGVVRGFPAVILVLIGV